MKKELRFGFDENDDVANVIDLILTAPGVHILYSRSDTDDWISKMDKRYNLYVLKVDDLLVSTRNLSEIVKPL